MFRILRELPHQGLPETGNLDRMTGGTHLLADRVSILSAAGGWFGGLRLCGLRFCGGGFGGSAAATWNSG